MRPRPLSSTARRILATIQKVQPKKHWKRGAAVCYTFQVRTRRQYLYLKTLANRFGAEFFYMGKTSTGYQCCCTDPLALRIEREIMGVQA